SEVTPKKSTWSVVEKVTFDPANVKAGDTATAEVSPVHTDGDGPKPFTITGEVWADGQTLMLGGWSITLPNLTLTDPQPAAEPEYEVGHVYEATVANVGRVQVVRVDPSMDADGPPLYPFPWFVPSKNDHYAEHVVTDVRP